jgi:hypothetical protein
MFPWLIGGSISEQQFIEVLPPWADIDAAHSLVESGALGKVVVDL